MTSTHGASCRHNNSGFSRVEPIVPWSRSDVKQHTASRRSAVRSDQTVPGAFVHGAHVGLAIRNVLRLEWSSSTAATSR